MNITQFSILGERCSGTNFLEEAMINNFNVTYTAKYGNKHFFCFNQYENDKQLTNNTLFIGIIRNPIYWLNSFSKELYHIPDINKKNLSTFLFNDFYSVEDENNNNNNNNNFIINSYKKKNKINMKDLNYITGTKYKNIFEMRKIKNDFLIYIMPQKVNNYILINYEDLLYNYDETLNKIKEQFLLTQKFHSFIKIKKYKKSDNYNFVQQREISFPPPIIHLLWTNLDIQQEKKLGYLPFDNNSLFKNRYINNDINTNNNHNDNDNIPLIDG
jgi:hypothetical protein